MSEWGHDFRPDYLRLGDVIEALGHPTYLLCSATASPIVRDEIIKRLSMRSPRVIVRGFDRPNIWLGVETFHDSKEKHNAFIERVVNTPKPGIVYVATRKRTEEIAAALCDKGIKGVYYHAQDESRRSPASPNRIYAGSSRSNCRYNGFWDGSR